MACKNCESTMHNLGGLIEGETTWWCPICGSTKTQQRGGTIVWVAPRMLVDLSKVYNTPEFCDTMNKLLGKQVVRRLVEYSPKPDGAGKLKSMESDIERMVQICRQVLDELDAVVEDNFSGMSVSDLRQEADAWIAEPSNKLIHALGRTPKDTAAMIATCYYRAMLRKAEAQGMEVASS